MTLEKWRKANQENRDEYVNIIRDVFRLNKSCIVARSSERINQSMNGRIDIWWLVDDGGLPLFLSNLLKKKYPKLELKVMILSSEDIPALKHTILITRLLKKVFEKRIFIQVSN